MENNDLQTNTEQVNVTTSNAETAQFANTENVNGKTETTYEDVFTKLGKKITDKEAFETLKNGYQKQFASTLAKSKLADIEARLLSEYAEIKAEKLAEIKAEAKFQEKIKQNSLEANAFLEKHGLSELTEEELNEALTYPALKEKITAEESKNPIIAKIIKESLPTLRAKAQPLPKASNQEITPDFLNEKRNQLNKLLIKQRAAGLTGAEKKDFEEISEVLLKYNFNY